MISSSRFSFFLSRFHDVFHVIAASRVWQPPPQHTVQKKSFQGSDREGPIGVCIVAWRKLCPKQQLGEIFSWGGFSPPGPPKMLSKTLQEVVNVKIAPRCLQEASKKATRALQDPSRCLQDLSKRPSRPSQSLILNDPTSVFEGFIKCYMLA